MTRLSSKDQKLFDAIQDPSAEFDLLEELGQGAFGAVWSASLKGTKVKPAVKVVTLEPGTDLTEYRQEVELMRTLQHLHIIQMYGAWISGNELWIAMEKADISVLDLMRVLARPLVETSIISIAQQTTNALAYLHERGIVHRDLKCGNLLLASDGSSRLCDFGVSAVVKDEANKRRTVVGSPYWMAPEVIKEVGYAQPADIWGLAITMIEMAEMNPPLSDMQPMRVLFLIPSNPTPTLSEPSQWSKEFNTILAACLQKRPAARPSAKQILRAPWFSKAPKGCLKRLVKTLRESQAKIKKCGGMFEAMDHTDEPKKLKSQEEIMDSLKNKSNEEEEDEVDLSAYLGGVDTFVAKPSATTRKKKSERPIRKNLGNVVLKRTDTGHIKAQAVKKKKRKKRKPAAAVEASATDGDNTELAAMHSSLRAVGLDIKSFRKEMLANEHIREEAMTRLQEFTRRLQELSQSPLWKHPSCSKYTSRIERSREKATEIMLKIQDSAVMVKRVSKASLAKSGGSGSKKKKGSAKRRNSVTRPPPQQSKKPSTPTTERKFVPASASPLRVDAAKNSKARSSSPRTSSPGRSTPNSSRKSGSGKKKSAPPKKAAPGSESPKKSRKKRPPTQCRKCKWQVPPGIKMKFCGQCSAPLE